MNSYNIREHTFKNKYCYYFLTFHNTLCPFNATQILDDKKN